ncbi:MAG: hypothetical protein HQK49_21045 [Oligoflexia bacterium]|nr:hypothetical protein [Oligoflexia bacterium]
MTAIFWVKNGEEKDLYLEEMSEEVSEEVSEGVSEGVDKTHDFRFVISEEEFNKEFESKKPRAIFFDNSSENQSMLDLSKLIKRQFPHIFVYYLESETLTNEQIIKKQNTYKAIDGIIKKPLSIDFVRELYRDLQEISIERKDSV